jgi:hypothetical protein
MFRAIVCLSSGGSNCILQHLVSSLSVIHILQNKAIVHQVGDKNKFTYFVFAYFKIIESIANLTGTCWIISQMPVELMAILGVQY